MLDGDTLTVAGDWGAERKVPVRGSWLGLARARPQSAGKAAPDWDL